MTISVTETALDMEKKAFTGCCARRSPLRSWLTWIYCLTFLTSFSIFFVFWCTNGFQDYVHSHLALRNGTNTYAWWRRPPLKILYKIHVFNYTNVDDYEAYHADKLRVEDVGPYIYVETKSRVNVEFHENDTLTYQEKKSFEWTGGRPDNEIIVVPNLPLISSVAFVRDMSFAAQLGLTAMLSTLREQPFINVTTGGFLWGYENRLFHVLKPFLKLKQDIQFEKFGLLAMKAGLDSDSITINTGNQDIGNFGIIERVNGMDKRNIWEDERCDKIEGTDGTMFPPHLIKNTNEPLYVYMKDLCRKAPYHFSGHVTTFDIPTLRYKLLPDMFNYSDTQNKCFCPKIHGTRACPPLGIMNMSACSFNSPLLSSFPHFYGADTSLLEQVDGLNPQQEAHESYMDVHPILGSPIAGWTRFQINLEVRRAVGVPFLGRLKDGAILPIIWIEIGMDELPDIVLETIHEGYFTVITVQAVFQWCSLIAMILSLGALIFCLRKYRMEQVAALQSESSDPNKLLELS